MLIQTCHTSSSYNGHLEIVESLLKKNANPNTPCNVMMVPLYIGSQNCHLQIVERLLKIKSVLTFHGKLLLIDSTKIK